MEFKLPELGENIQKGDVVNVLVKEGDRIVKEQPVLEVETDKAVLEVPAPVDGVVQKVFVQAGTTISVGQLVMNISGAEGEVAQPTQPKSSPAVSTPAQSKAPAVEHREVPQSDYDGPVRTTPVVRKLARQLGVDLSQVVPTGERGRITIEDVRYYKPQATTSGVETGAISSLPELPDFSALGEVEKKSFNGVRRATVKSMSQSWSLIPHVTQFDKADVTGLMDQIQKKNKKNAESKLTMTAVIVHQLASALQEFPEFNASIDVANEEILLKKFYNIGVAVDTHRGLLVPVLRQVDQKDVLKISEELNDVAARAREAKVTLDELKGATFTVTNLGGLGTSYFTPIVNWPEVAILGVGRAEVTPVLEKEKWVPKKILPLSISYDHRLIDGANAARFLRFIAQALENTTGINK